MEDATRAFLKSIRSGRERSVCSALFDLVNRFDVDYLKHLARPETGLMDELQRLSVTAEPWSKRSRVLIDGSLTLLRLMNEGECRCWLLAHGVPACPLNLEQAKHMINVDGVSAHYGEQVTRLFECSYCGTAFTATECPGTSDPHWRPVA